MVTRLRRGMLAVLLSAGLALTGGAGAVAQEAPPPDVEPRQFQIGLLATEGATRALEAWGPTAAALNAAAAAQQLPYGFSIKPHNHGSLIEAVESASVDLLLTDSASFVAAEVKNGARAMLSMAHMWDDQALDMTGALVFVRSDSAVRSLGQLEGKKIMAVAKNDFAGWWLAEQEIRKHRLDPRDLMSEVVFSGGNEREVIYAVQSGLVDVGVIRAGMLETLARKGVVDLADFAPVSRLAVEGYPFWVSTPLFPEWVMAAMPDMPEEALALVINTLLQVTPEDAASRAAGDAVWQAPQNYQAVHDLLISLRVRPYENYYLQAANRIYQTYKWLILGVAALSLLSLAFLIYELRRNMQLAEERRDVLKSETRSKKFYRSAIEEHTVFCMLTPDGTITHVNERFLKVSARSRQGLISQSLDMLLDTKDHTRLHDEIMTSMELGVPWSGALKLNKNDGSPAWVQCTFIPVTSSSEQLSEVAMVATDVTKTTQGVSEKRFHNTLELIQDQVFVMRPHSFEFLHCNEAAERHLAKRSTGGDWRGKGAEDFITAEDFRTLALRSEAIVEGPQRRVTWETEAKDGTVYEISLEYAEPDQDESRLIAIYRDITERKAAEKAKNEFIATVSHELRTPLTSMKGALGLALSGAVGEMPEKMNKLVTMANSNCDRLVMMINDILDLEKIEAGKMEFNLVSCDLRDLIAAAMEANHFYAEKFGVKFVSNIRQEDIEHLTMGDVGRLRQVMDNLMSNAAKFSPKGSEIIVSLFEHKGSWRISIRDFGSGIPAAAQGRIFDKFSQADSSDTRSKGGTGLGLAIVKQIVENHDGRIFFVSVEEVGTEFFVDLPRIEDGKVVPIAAENGEAIAFSEFAEPAVVPVGDLAEQAVSQLLQRARAVGASVEVEFGRVNALQVAKGRGAVSQSTILAWMSAEGRALLSSLVETKKLDNREALVVEMTLPAPDEKGQAPQLTDAVPLVHDWMVQAVAAVGGSDEEGAKAPELTCTLVSGDATTVGWAADSGYQVVDDTLQAATMADQEPQDAIILYHNVDESGVATIFPLSDGNLPKGLPVTVLVTHQEQAESERGVVSKFAGGEMGGRGRARRRNAS
ncbi:PhnD/SsuA/transferrin family substrate-binding protein [Shimia sp.]|uniref:PhnD/SsuA/transferrin family substrate-binding protein n=1 Tax=Shimia sp. TaxID=1954381 RepID=UPI003565372F